jgi:hypothetical protein
MDTVLPVNDDMRNSARTIELRKRRLALAALIGLTSMLGLVTGIYRSVYESVRRLHGIAESMIGKPESDLMRVPGSPRYIARIADLKNRTVDYPWRSMNFVPVPTRLVRNKVLLYSTWNHAT